MGQINIGLASIAIGAVAADGGMGTTLAPLGKTLEGTLNLNTDDPQVAEFYSEEDEDPIHEEQRAGKKSLTFTIADPDLDTLVSVWGGTKSGVAPNEIYTPPANTGTIERSIKITPKRGLGFNIVRARINAKFTPGIGRASLLGLEITGSVMTPTKADTRSMTYFKV